MLVDMKSDYVAQLLYYLITPDVGFMWSNLYSATNSRDFQL